MSRLEDITGRALELAESVGDNLKGRVPDRALQWMETGAALGALKTGGRVATRLAKRNPAVAAATAAVTVAGVLVYLVRRHQKKVANGGAINGTSTRIDAKSARARRATSRRERNSADT